MVGTKSAALFASRMSNERSAGELRPRKMEYIQASRRLAVTDWNVRVAY